MIDLLFFLKRQVFRHGSETARNPEQGLLYMLQMTKLKKVWYFPEFLGISSLNRHTSELNSKREIEENSNIGRL